MDHLQRSLLNYFVDSGVDHLSIRRGDSGWLSNQFEEDAQRFIMWRGKFLVADAQGQTALVQFSADQIRAIDAQAVPIFLGRLLDDSRGSVFVVNVDANLATLETELEARGSFIDLRTAGGKLNSREATLVSQAKAIGEWHDRHRYCPRCASPVVCVSGGHVLRCQSESCGRDHFPRLDPAIIVRVTIDDRILLGRQATWAPRQYSVIAGFAEPGESLEQSVAREVFEETGITVSEVHYQSSQPWPFPSNMMLGYEAVAAHDQLKPNDNELEHVRWYTRDQMVEGFNDESLRVPPSISISFRLIEDWFNQGTHGDLGDIVRRTGARWVPPPAAS